MAEPRTSLRVFLRLSMGGEGGGTALPVPVQWPWVAERMHADDFCFGDVGGYGGEVAEVGFFDGLWKGW